MQKKSPLARIKKRYPYGAKILRRSFKLQKASKKDLEFIADLLEDRSREGPEGEHIAYLLSTGLSSGAIKHKDLPKLLASMDRINKWTSDNGHGASTSRDELGRGFKSKVFTSKNLDTILPLLEEAARAGHDPKHLASALSAGLGSGAISHESLPESAQAIKDALEETKKAGHDPYHLASLLSAALKSGAVTHDTLPESAQAMGYILGGGVDPETVWQVWLLDGDMLSEKESLTKETCLMSCLHYHGVCVREMIPSTFHGHYYLLWSAAQSRKEICQNSQTE